MFSVPCPVPPPSPPQILGPLEGLEDFTLEDFQLLEKMTWSSSTEKVKARVKQMGMKGKQYAKTLRYVMPCYDTPRYVMLLYVMLRHDTLRCYATLCHATPCYATLRPTVLHYAVTPHYVTPRYVMLC